MKYSYALSYIPFHFVAPFTGAWIEIDEIEQARRQLDESHPSRVRGLKLGLYVGGAGSIGVAPFTGAWIEIPF